MARQGSRDRRVELNIHRIRARDGTDHQIRENARPAGEDDSLHAVPGLQRAWRTRQLVHLARHELATALTTDARLAGVSEWHAPSQEAVEKQSTRLQADLGGLGGCQPDTDGPGTVRH
jgi:hypothetical protein